MKQKKEVPKILEGKRKGIGYMLEAIIATVTIFIFAVGQTPSEPAQDWSRFQKEIAASDLSHTLKKTGDINSFLRRKETGSLETAVHSMTDENLEVSGSIENLPLRGSRIGFSTIPEERHKADLRPVESTDTCGGDLEEIEQQPGTPVNRTAASDSQSGIVVYVADTDPQDPSGFNNQWDYDTLWVDNGTECQFSSSEGPYYFQEFFKWKTSSTNSEYYEFTNVSDSDNRLNYYNASIPVEIRNELNSPINGIKTDQEIDVFAPEKTDLDTYDLMVLKREQLITKLNSDSDLRNQVKDYMEDSPVLLLTNISETELKGDFIEDTGLRHVDLSFSEAPDNARFGSNPESKMIENYFKGLEGDQSDIKLAPGGKISSSNGEDFMEERQLVFTEKGDYVTDPWNATNYGMDERDADTIDGEPESSCYSEDGVEGNNPTDALTEGSFSFQTGTYDVISTRMGKNSCKNVRALSIDRNNNGRYDDQGEGPFLNGEKITVDGRKYYVEVTDSDSAEFVFDGRSKVELVNYRNSYPGIDGGSRLARIGLKESYSDDDRKLIASTIYWLLDDSVNFGESLTSPVSTRLVGSVKEEVYMPYKMELRWE